MKSLKLVIYLIFIITLSSCDQTKQYTGKVIEFDFNNVENISPDLWMEIDEWRFEHVASLEEGVNTEFPLPTDYIIVDDSREDRDFGTPLEPRSVGTHMARNLREINTERLSEDSSKYTIINPGLIAVAGILKLAKVDSSEITVKVPKSYPIAIRVLNR